MKLTGKQLKDNSAYVEFDVDVLPTSDEQQALEERQSSYDAIWLGKSTFIEGGFSIILGFDDMESEDLALIKEYLDEESHAEIDDMYKFFKTIEL